MINKVKIHPRVFVSPLFRAIETVTLLLESHPQRDEITLVLCPMAKEAMLSSCTVPRDFEELCDYTQSLNKFKFDFSLFDKLESKKHWGISVMTDADKKAELMQLCQEQPMWDVVTSKL